MDLDIKRCIDSPPEDEDEGALYPIKRTKNGILMTKIVFLGCIASDFVGQIETRVSAREACLRWFFDMRVCRPFLPVN